MQFHSQNVPYGANTEYKARETRKLRYRKKGVETEMRIFGILVLRFQASVGFIAFPQTETRDCAVLCLQEQNKSDLVMAQS